MQAFRGANHESRPELGLGKDRKKLPKCSALEVWKCKGSPERPGLRCIVLNNGEEKIATSGEEVSQGSPPPLVRGSI